MKTIARRLSPFAILLPASLLSACASLGNAGLGGSQQNPTNQLLNMIDEATREGMSVVLVPALMPNKSVTDLSSYSHRVIFKNKDVPGIAYMQAFANNDLEKIKEAVYLWDFLEVNIVPPGTYLLSGGIDYKIDSTLAQIKAPKAAGCQPTWFGEPVRRAVSPVREGELLARRLLCRQNLHTECLQRRAHGLRPMRGLDRAAIQPAGNGLGCRLGRRHEDRGCPLHQAASADTRRLCPAVLHHSAWADPAQRSVPLEDPGREL